MPQACDYSDAAMMNVVKERKAAEAAKADAETARADAETAKADAETALKKEKVNRTPLLLLVVTLRSHTRQAMREQAEIDRGIIGEARCETTMHANVAGVAAR